MRAWGAPAAAPTPALAPDARGRGVARLASLAAAALAAVHFASFDVLDKGLVTDVRYYVYMAWQITEGVPPHVSSFDPKTQFASFVGALLFALGELVGTEPLYAMRAGTLALAALGAWLAFPIHRRLAGGSALCGLVGTLAVCSFGLVGALAAIGPVPKLGMVVATGVAALLVHGRRWLAAGAVATAAFLDWQIGALTCVSALGCALLFGRPRLGAALRVLAGGALVGGAYVAYFAWHGALRAAWEQTVVSALFRGSSAVGRRTFGEHVAWILETAREDCPEQVGLFYAGLAGIPVTLALLWRLRRDERASLLVPLVAVHLGVVLFSLVDFQGHGDLAPLLQAAAFFLAAAVGWPLSRLERRLPGARARAALAGAVLVGAVLAARPGPLRPELAIGTATHAADVTLEDQREVAAEVRRLAGGRELAFLQYSELLYLLRHRNPLPTVYWNVATEGYLRRSPSEPAGRIVGRLLHESGADGFLFDLPGRAAPLAPGWTRHRIASSSGRYVVLLQLRD